MIRKNVRRGEVEGPQAEKRSEEILPLKPSTFDLLAARRRPSAE
jgi:hypothetical protein